MIPRIYVTVTITIIKNAIAHRQCPIVDAIRSAYPSARRIAVDLRAIRFTDADTRLRYTYVTPRMAQAAIQKFDQGWEPSPFTFQLPEN